MEDAFISSLRKLLLWRCTAARPDLSLVWETCLKMTKVDFLGYVKILYMKQPKKLTLIDQFISRIIY